VADNADVVEEVSCAQCGKRFASRTRHADGSAELRVYGEGIYLTVVSKQERLGRVTCPACGHGTAVDLADFGAL
jgi:transcription elongation factor Elf1